jgi:hypothetical protein
MGTKSQFYKDPAAILDYVVDWTAWLGTDTISQSTWTVQSGITQVTATNTTKLATIWVSGGAAGTTYTLTNRITTVGGRTDERSITITVGES